MTSVAHDTMKRFASVLLHLVMLALVCAIAAYWVIRIMTPPPASAPPPQLGAVLRQAEPVLAARMFGLLQAAPVQLATNVQALGVFAAGKDSAAVLAVDGKPARVYLLNQEIASGAKLVEVRKDAVIIEQNGVRRGVSLPAPEPLNLGGSPPPPAFQREGNTLTAPSVAAGTQGAGAPPRPLPPRLPVVPQPFVPQMPQPVPPQPLQPEQLQQQTPPQAVQSPDEAQREGQMRRAMPNRPLTQ